MHTSQFGCLAQPEIQEVPTEVIFSFWALQKELIEFIK
jgi:hypothetical protein